MPQCKNCNAELKGQFCYQCGQDTGSPIRNVFGIVGEYLGETGNFDGRFWRTMIPLFIRPGFLSNEYVVDRRAPYVPPLRLYIFISIFAFIVFNAFVERVNFEVNGNPQDIRAELEQQGVSDEEVLQQLDELDEQQENMQSLPELINNLELPFLKEVDQQAFEARMARYADDPRLLVHKFLSVAPQLMFIALPLFAAVFKLMYWRSNRYFMEHLVLALHTHAIVLLLISLIIVFSMMQSSMEASWGEGVWLYPLSWMIGLVWLWIPIYVLMAQKTFYRQGWVKTITKFFISSLVWWCIMSTLVLVAILRSVLFD
ncbi:MULTISPECIES: DUF3667 domain-containing protein [Gammaproteobacteria]|uniref:DUF3667 domain-containing protein n=1 Tax=Gammaproteobacteria TaxID=1236 RepID=UPI000DD0CE53|nr:MULTISPECIES: DUF3667 domain-containing protein [Gammaproteobacteria]RTE87057.1 DUF3667 domain-containing protein [Aliidiomarina sp. B3213]TCZ93153.1 DUF3667 domain-containing protein [Lysobacter sp. N42]